MEILTDDIIFNSLYMERVLTQQGNTRLTGYVYLTRVLTDTYFPSTSEMDMPEQLLGSPNY